jgi:hypothetical protein
MMRINSGNIAIQQGSCVLFSDYADDGIMWSGSGVREHQRMVMFKERFAAPPAVMSGISMWDIHHQHNARCDVRTERITDKGFQIVFRTWGDSRIARVRVEWTAFGQVTDGDDWDVL